MRFRPGRPRFPLLFAVIAACGPAAQADTSSGTLTVTATVLSKNQCKFSTKSLALDFQTIDPSAAAAKTATATATFVCNGNAATAAYVVSADDGKYRSAPGARRMRGVAATTEFLPYSLSWSPGSGTVPKGAFVSVTFTGSVAPADFQQARSDSYSDTVILTVAP